MTQLKENDLWHGFEHNEILKALTTSEKGLTDNEASKRLEKYGSNELISEKKESLWKLLFQQFQNIAVIILFIAAVISGFIGQAIESVAIIIIIILAAILGFFQEYQAGKAIDSLKKMAAPNATVIRDGIEKIINAKNIVKGDIFLLKAGDKIPADARLIEANNLKVDEAALTGESLPVEKYDVMLAKENIPTGDQKNMVFSGTTVTYGRGKAVVVTTGMNTEFGKIARLLQETETNQTPLQQNINSLTKWFGIFSIILAFLMSFLGLLRGYSIREMVIWGISLAVAVMPEALPAVVTISLAIGVKRMVKRSALIRKLPAVETLGATSIICSDKTGTLTKDEMTIKKIFINNQIIDITGTGYEPKGSFLKSGNEISLDENLNYFLNSSVLCNDSQLINKDNEWGITGDPTEAAILVTAVKAGLNTKYIRDSYPRIKEVPFSSDTRKMTTAHQYKNKILIISKGAPEVILDSCKYIRINNQKSELTNVYKNKINMVYEEFAGQALRVIALSTYEGEETENIDLLLENNEMIFEGLFGMIDPPRTEVKEAISICNKAGIKPVMVTGDHKLTAMAIGKELGILKSGIALSGSELEELTDEELDSTIENAEIFARISPAHKLRIVNAFMNKGYIVAMTGDGVNDAPALKRANIGIAMGINGTDVSREASDMVLTDDNFASIVSAIEEGRAIFENIRKYLVFLISGNIGTIIALSSALFLNLPIPLTALNILYINFIMDGMVAIALGIEPPEKGIIKRKPRNVKNGIMDKSSIISSIISSIVIGTVVSVTYIITNHDSTDNKYSSTVFFATLIMSRVFNGFNSTSITDSVLNIKFSKNKYLIFSCLISLIITLVIIYNTNLNKIFSTVPIDKDSWLLILFSSSFVLIIMEIWKFFSKNLSK